MKINIRQIIIAVCVMSVPAMVYAEAPGAAFLKIPPDARAASMGGAQMASGFNAASIWWNPGALSRTARQEMFGTHALWIEGMQYDSLCYAHPMGNKTIAGSFVMLDAGTLDGRDAQGNKSSDFNVRDYAVSCAYSRMLANNISLGCSLKLIRQEIEQENATGWALDIGSVMPLPVQGMHLGWGIQNIGPRMSFISDKYPLPTTAGIGVGYTLSGVLLAGDIKYDYHSNKMEYLTGVEYTAMDAMSLRLGCLYSSLSGAMSGLGGGDSFKAQKFGVRGGFGLKMSGYRMDYAYIPFGELGSTHQITFSLRK